MKPSLLRPYLRYAGLQVASFADDQFEITTQMVFVLRQLDYIGQWRASLQNGWYHVLLADHSMLAFTQLGPNLSLSYLPCPIEVPTFDAFLANMGVRPTLRNKAEYADAYQLAFDTAPIRDAFTPIRYDLDRGAYRRCVHPSAHLHIGLDNEIRLATRRELTPVAFTLFVIRQAYPENWSRLMGFHENLKLQRRVRDDLLPVTENHWNDEDEFQTYLF